MIKSMTVTNHLGNSLKIPLQNYWETGFLIQSIEGIGPQDSEINITELYATNGAIFNSARRGSRDIELSLIFRACLSDPVTSSIEDIRQKTYVYFPPREKLTLTFETDNRTLNIDGYVEENDPDIFSDMETTTISIVCPQPFFYNEYTFSSTIGKIEPYFHFPFWNYASIVSYNKTDPPEYSNPLWKIDTSGNPYTFSYDHLLFGKVRDLYSVNINNEGDVEIGICMIFVIQENMSFTGDYIHIRNTTTEVGMDINLSTVMDIVGISSFKANDSFVINTITGQKEFSFYRNNKEYNILQALPRFTDWLTLVKGMNTIEITLDDTDYNYELDKVYMTVNVKFLYEGV